MTLRLPLRALPLAIRVVRAVKRALARIEDDLASLVEPVTVDDLVSNEWRGTPLDVVVDPNLGTSDVYYVDLTRPTAPCATCGTPCTTVFCGARCASAGLDGRCFECGTSDPTGFCPAHRVLDKGRVN